MFPEMGDDLETFVTGCRCQLYDIITLCLFVCLCVCTFNNPYSLGVGKLGCTILQLVDLLRRRDHFLFHLF